MSIAMPVALQELRYGSLGVSLRMELDPDGRLDAVVQDRDILQERTGLHGLNDLGSALVSERPKRALLEVRVATVRLVPVVKVEIQADCPQRLGAREDLDDGFLQCSSGLSAGKSVILISISETYVLC